MTLSKQDLFNVAVSAGAWRSRAYQLRIAAEVLFKPYSRQLDGNGRVLPDEQLRNPKYLVVGPVILMLAGLALENLAKGLWVRKNKPLPPGRLPTELTKSHRVTIDLLKAVGVQLTPEESTLVKMLQTSVTWAGRYPVPRRPEEMELPRHFGQTEFRQFRQLFDRLIKKWNSQPRGGFR